MSDEVSLIREWIAQGQQTDDVGIPIPPRMDEGEWAAGMDGGEAQAAFDAEPEPTPTGEPYAIRRVKAWLLAVEKHGRKGQDFSAPSGVALKWLERLLNALPEGPDSEDAEDLANRIDAGSLHASREPTWALDPTGQVERLADYLNDCDGADPELPAADQAMNLLTQLQQLVSALLTKEGE